MQFGELGSTAQEAEETVKEVSCASAMLTIMTRKMIRASRGTNPTPQRWHSSDNAYIMFCCRGTRGRPTTVHPDMRKPQERSNYMYDRALRTEVKSIQVKESKSFLSSPPPVSSEYREGSLRD
jgi:hypothetical protein